jgi:hypothetical protein
MNFFLLFLLFFFPKSYSYVILPFDTKIEDIKLDSTNFYQKKYYNNIQTKISLGTPYQTIPLSIMIKQYPTIITSKYSNLDITNLFDQKKSDSYTELKKNPLRAWESIYKECYFGNDNFSIINNSKDTKSEKFNFLLGMEMGNKLNGLLGLSLKSTREDLNEYGFIYQLKQKKLIESSVFFIQFDSKNNNKGELIIGKYPHEINSKKFKESDFLTVSSYIPSYIDEFDFNFNSIYYGDQLVQNMGITYLEIEKNFIQASESFGSIITNNFFSKYVEQGLCKEINLEVVFYTYICEKKINLKEFKELKFTLNNVNFTFSLNAKDLFYEMDNNLYFLIYYTKKNGNTWSFGKIFFTKYFLVFDSDKEIIGFYKKINEGSIIGTILIILFVIGFLVLIILLLRYLINKYYTKGKGNILIENFIALQEKKK